MDLNFGVTRWYLKPLLYIRVINIVVSAWMIIFLFDSCINLSDSMWVYATSRFPLILCSLIAISFLGLLFSNIILFFKVFPDHSHIVFLSSAIFFILYIIIILIVAIFHGGMNDCHYYSKKILEFISMEPDNVVVILFLQSIRSSNQNDLKISILQYTKNRTILYKRQLVLLSIFFVVSFIIIIYSMMYEGSFSQLLDESEDISNLKDLERE